MSAFKTGLSAIGRLATIAIMLVAFMAGMAGVVYMSLSGEEIRVPEIVGKDFVESEKELAALGLKIKKRADRPSNEKINTVLEQLPRPGETVKSGQMILVVVSKAGGPGEQVPSTLKENIESDDSEKIEEMISDKPKKPRASTNSNVNANSNKRVADTKRDVMANTSTTSANTGPPANTSSTVDGTQTGDRPNRNTATPQTPKPPPTPATDRPAAGDVRPRSTPRP